MEKIKDRYAQRELCVNEKLGSYTVGITDDNGELIAVFQGSDRRSAGRDPLRERHVRSPEDPAD